jgi:hypothetical protein
MIKKIKNLLFKTEQKKADKEKAKLTLAAAADDKVFFVSNGMMLRSLYELRDAFISMSDDTFNYHANSAKNDFCTWITDIHKDNDLAERLNLARSRIESFKIISDRIAYFEKLLR